MAGRGRPGARATSRAPDATATPNACRVEVREAARARRAGRTADAPPWSGHHAPSYGSLFFAGARTLEEALPEVRPRAAVLLLLRGRADLGSTFLGVIARYGRALAAAGGVLFLVGVSDRAYVQLERTRVLHVVGREHMFCARSLYGHALLAAWSAARRRLGLGEGELPWAALLDARGAGTETVCKFNGDTRMTEAHHRLTNCTCSEVIRRRLDSPEIAT